MDVTIAGLILAVIQGIAEWFPISSSSHLVIFSKILGFDNTLAFDLALHFGTLLAVFVYFGRDIVKIIEDILKGNFQSEHAKLGYNVIIASVPIAIVGFFLHNFVEETLGNLSLIAFGLAVTSVVLFIGSIDLKKRVGVLGYGSAFLVGCAEVLSIFRGVSRSGTTISSGLLLGLNEKNAVKFSFLLSIPVIFGANIIEMGNQSLPKEYLWPALVAAVVGLASIHTLIKVVLTSRKNLRWFGLYTLLLAIGIGLYLILI